LILWWDWEAMAAQAQRELESSPGLAAELAAKIQAKWVKDDPGASVLTVPSSEAETLENKG